MYNNELHFTLQNVTNDMKDFIVPFLPFYELFEITFCYEDPHDNVVLQLNQASVNTLSFRTFCEMVKVLLSK